MKRNIEFPRRFSWEVLHGVSSSREPIFYYPNGREDQDGLYVRVIPEIGDAWIGNFGGVATEYHSGIYSTPNPNVICVVFNGAGYLVNVVTPTEFDNVPLIPIVEVRVSDQSDMMVFVDFTKIAVYNADGLLWESEQVSRDGIKITEISKHGIYGLAWDPIKGREVEFNIDLKTGKLTGGSFY